MRDFFGSRIMRAIFLVCALVLAPSAHAASADDDLPSHPAPTRDDLTTLFDGMIPEQLERHDIAGAYVAVVVKGEIVFAKGYGYADVAARKPITNDTLFRVGSISKLMTWTAVMQLVEQGKIDLDADINHYLDFTLPAAFGKSITMRQVMTHTAGFEDGIRGLWTTPAEVEQLRSYLVDRTPQRIFAPGTVVAYSNYGASLAGYVVQRVSGEPFNAYVARHITEPLAMRRSTFVQPLGADLAPSMSASYDRATRAATKFEVMIAPAGGLTTSGPDMARFMLAFLQNGSLDGQQILKPETVALMHARHWAADPRENAMGLGWLGGSYNGLQLIGHGGDTLFFHANMDLIPQAHTGLFVVYNSNGKHGRMGGRVLRSFMDRYFPDEATQAGATTGAVRGNGAEIAGLYMASRRGQSNMGYLYAILEQTRVSVNPNGSVTTSKVMPHNRPPSRWSETAPGYWSAEDGQQRYLIFQKAADGNWQFSNGNPASVYQRAAWYQHALLVMGLLGFAVLACMLSMVAWPLVAWRRRARPGQSAAAAAQRPVHLAAALCLLAWAVSGGMMALALMDRYVVATPTYAFALRGLQLAIWLHALGSVVLLWRSRTAWRAGGHSIWTRSHQLLVALACLTSIWLCWQGNFLSLALRY